MAKIYNFFNSKQQLKQQNYSQDMFAEFRNDRLFNCTEDLSKKRYEKVWILVNKQYFTYYKTLEECKQRRSNDKKFERARICEVENIWNYKIIFGRVYIRTRNHTINFIMKPEVEYIELFM